MNKILIFEHCIKAKTIDTPKCTIRILSKRERACERQKTNRLAYMSGASAMKHKIFLTMEQHVFNCNFYRGHY